MAAIRDRLVDDVAAWSKYSSFYRHPLSVRPQPEWMTTFGRWFEATFGNHQPHSARPCRPLWSTSKVGVSHGYSRGLHAAGWIVREVDIEAEARDTPYSTGAPVRPGKAARTPVFDLDRDFPPWDAGPWPEGFTVSREQIYDDMGRLTGGPEDSSGGEP